MGRKGVGVCFTVYLRNLGIRNLFRGGIQEQRYFPLYYSCCRRFLNKVCSCFKEHPSAINDLHLFTRRPMLVDRPRDWRGHFWRCRGPAGGGQGAPRLVLLLLWRSAKVWVGWRRIRVRIPGAIQGKDRRQGGSIQSKNTVEFFY